MARANREVNGNGPIVRLHDNTGTAQVGLGNSGCEKLLSIYRWMKDGARRFFPPTVGSDQV